MSVASFVLAPKTRPLWAKRDIFIPKCTERGEGGPPVEEISLKNILLFFLSASLNNPRPKLRNLFACLLLSYNTENAITEQRKVTKLACLLRVKYINGPCLWHFWPSYYMSCYNLYMCPYFDHVKNNSEL